MKVMGLSKEYALSNGLHDNSSYIRKFQSCVLITDHIDFTLFFSSYS